MKEKFTITIDDGTSGGVQVVPEDDVVKLKKKYYWSRSPGKFVNKLTGQSVNLSSSLSIGPAFTGTVREWYETLVETIIDIYNSVPEPTNSVYVGADVSTMLMASVLFKPTNSVAWYGNQQITKIGVLCGHDVYFDPSLKNIIKIGHHNGGSWYEGEIEVLDMNVI
jgi:hypothetical protein